LRKDFKYTAFDQPYSIAITGGDSATNGVSQFKYGPDLQRIYSKSPDSVNSTLETNYVNGDDSLGLSMERIKRTVAGAAVINYRHYVGVAGVTIAQIDVPENVDPASLSPVQGLERRYFVQDAIGSSSLVLNHSGVVVERSYYDPWGRRRSAATGQFEDELSTSLGHVASRGYTMHEHLPSVGLIHMNGRLYDPILGRFIQADSLVSNPDNLQSYNRYAYVNNNPLSYSDPTGNFEYPAFDTPVNTIPGNPFPLTSPLTSPPIYNPQPFITTPSGGQNSNYVPGFSTIANPLDTLIGPSILYSNIGSTASNSPLVGYSSNGFSPNRGTNDSALSSGGYLFSESGPFAKVEQAFSNWWSASKAGFQSATLLETLGKGLQAFPIEAGFVGALGSISNFGSKVVEPTMLGLRAFGLESTASNLGARTLLSDANWKSKFLDLVADRNTVLMLSLDGLKGANSVEKILNAVTQGATKAATATNWEIRTLYESGRLGTIQLFSGGKLVPNPF
jgi:RHS repeat-associated protein